MNKRRPTYEELEARLAEAEPILEALRRHEVDAVVGEEAIAFLLLREVGEALLASESAFRAMFELPGIGMIQADAPAFRFTRVNQKFCAISGYSANELLGKTYIDLTHPGDRQRDMKLFSQVLRGKSDGWSIEKRCVRKDGSIVRVGVNGAVVRDAARGVVRMIAMVNDLTSRKQASQKRSVAEKAPQRSGRRANHGGSTDQRDRRKRFR